MLNTKDLIGLEVCQASEILEKSGVASFKFVYYTDRKQNIFDKELVTAVRKQGEELTLIVCRYKFVVQ